MSQVVVTQLSTDMRTADSQIHPFYSTFFRILWQSVLTQVVLKNGSGNTALWKLQACSHRWFIYLWTFVAMFSTPLYLFASFSTSQDSDSKVAFGNIILKCSLDKYTVSQAFHAQDIRLPCGTWS